MNWSLHTVVPLSGGAARYIVKLIPYSEEASRFIKPLFSFFFPERVIDPFEEERDEDTYPFDSDVKPSRETHFTNAVAVLTGLLVDTWSICTSLFGMRPPDER